MCNDVEEKLWRAVIMRAIKDAIMSGINMPDKKEARRWICDGGLDFEYVCDLADVKPDVVRKYLKKRKPIKK